MLAVATGVVVDIAEDLPCLQKVVVRIGDGPENPCVGYPSLCGVLRRGDRVLVNTTAVDLGLGSGGVHFVVAKLDWEGRTAYSPGPGHIMKLRYTPLQHAVLACEEPDSPVHELLAETQSLKGMPVVAAQLHSQVAPAAVGIADAADRVGVPRPRVAYVMTDSAALPLALSDSVRTMKEHGLLCGTVSCGQAFGGDLEAVNLYSGLAAARWALECDIAIVCQGPGNVGTGTVLGFSAIDQGIAVNAAAALDGRPVAVLRVSFADKRQRHRGVSHHTVTALCRVALAQADIAVPLGLPRAVGVPEALALIGRKHRLCEVDPSGALDALRKAPVPMHSMGRGLDDDPWFFLSAVCAGRLAFELYREH
ncbi:MAG: DUF3866 family protein [Armatimonadota bacterium]